MGKSLHKSEDRLQGLSFHKSLGRCLEFVHPFGLTGSSVYLQRNSAIVPMCHGLVYIFTYKNTLYLVTNRYNGFLMRMDNVQSVIITQCTGILEYDWSDAVL